MESVKEKGKCVIISWWFYMEKIWSILDGLHIFHDRGSPLHFAGLLKSRVVFGANIEALAAREKSRVPVIMGSIGLRSSSSVASDVPGWDCQL